MIAEGESFFNILGKDLMLMSAEKPVIIASIIRNKNLHFRTFLI